MKQKPIRVKAGNATVNIYRRVREIKKDGKRVGKRMIFEVDDRTTGIRKFRSFSDEEKARKEAERIANSLSIGEATAATIRNSEAASYGRAIELLRPLRTSLELAVAHYVKACEILGGDSVIEAAKFYALHRADKIQPRTVAEVVAELIAARESKGKSSRYVADLRARLNRFSKSFAVEISTVTGPDVQGWLDKLKVAPRTAKNFQSALHTLFAFAESHGYIIKGGNPVSGTEPIDADDEGPVEVFTPSEISALIEASPIEFQPVLTIGAFAGMRTAEIERLDWSEIDLAGGFIEVKAAKAKTRSSRIIPILPNLKAWLSPLAAQTGNVWKGTPASLIEARATTAGKAGVEWKHNALRHSFITYRVAEIQNVNQVSLEAGNSPQKIFKSYRKPVRPGQAKAWFSVVPAAPANIVPMAATASIQ